MAVTVTVTPIFQKVNTIYSLLRLLLVLLLLPFSSNGNSNSYVKREYAVVTYLNIGVNNVANFCFVSVMIF